MIELRKYLEEDGFFVGDNSIAEKMLGTDQENNAIWVQVDFSKIPLYKNRNIFPEKIPANLIDFGLQNQER